MNKNYPTREEWLEAAVKLMTPSFEGNGYTVPPVRVSVGWPSVRGLSNKQKRIGECWDKSCAKDGKAQVFISPILDDNPAAAQGVVDVLVHEVVHAVVGNECGHKGAFKKCALAVGLDGKMTATFAGPELAKLIEKWVAKLGKFPHAPLIPAQMKKQKKKQSTRMIKCECETCGYTVRTTRKWLEESGAPICPCNHKDMKFTLDGADDEEASDE